MKPEKLEDLTGRIIGRWQVLNYSHLENRRTYRRHMWNCMCDCGVVKKVLHSSLSKQNSLSCGCYNKERITETSYKRQKPKGESCLNHLFLVYKRGAMKRGLSFTLSKEEFRKLTSSTCFYCGVVPCQMTGRTKYVQVNGDYVYNGIDRIQNLIGYSIENCVSCCKICNYAKRTLSQEKFMSWIHRLILFQKESQNGKK